jgi:hypothetical protein
MTDNDWKLSDSAPLYGLLILVGAAVLVIVIVWLAMRLVFG